MRLFVKWVVLVFRVCSRFLVVGLEGLMRSSLVIWKCWVRVCMSFWLDLCGLIIWVWMYFNLCVVVNSFEIWGCDMCRICVIVVWFSFCRWYSWVVFRVIIWWELRVFWLLVWLWDDEGMLVSLICRYIECYYEIGIGSWLFCCIVDVVYI